MGRSEQRFWSERRLRAPRRTASPIPLRVSGGSAQMPKSGSAWLQGRRPEVIVRVWLLAAAKQARYGREDPSLGTPAVVRSLRQRAFGIDEGIEL